MPLDRSTVRDAWLAPLAAAVLATMSGAPPAQAAADGNHHAWADGDSYILMHAGEQDSTMMRGSTSDLRRARALRAGGEPLLYVRRDGKAYVIRDAATLRQAQAIFEPQRALGKKQAALGSRQAALGARQAALGARQAELSMRQVAERSGSEEVSRQQEELGRQQGALGEEQGTLGAQQARLGSEQERLGREAQAKLRSLVEDAVRRGLASEVG